MKSNRMGINDNFGYQRDDLTKRNSNVKKQTFVLNSLPKSSALNQRIPMVNPFEKSQKSSAINPFEKTQKSSVFNPFEKQKNVVKSPFKFDKTTAVQPFKFET